MKKTNVLEIISSLGEGGAESLVRDYALLIDREQFNLQILTVYRAFNSTAIKQLSESGITVESVLPGCGLLWKLFKWTIGYLYVPYRFKKIIDHNHIDVVHVHMNQLHHLVPIRRFLNDIRVFYTIHNDPEIYFRGWSRKREYNAVNKLKSEDTFSLIALHHHMATQLKNMFGFNRIFTIRNGVDFKRFSDIKLTKSEIRELNGIPADSFVIGHIGRFSEQKNHEMTVSIFCEIIKFKPDSFLLLIGSGPLMDTISDRLDHYGLGNKYVILSNRTDIPELLKAMDVFVLPSLFEGLPVSLIEAQVSKLPCVVSNNINKEAILLPSTVMLSLDAPLSVWATTILNCSRDIDWNEQITYFDMRKEIKRLEALYNNTYLKE